MVGSLREAQWNGLVPCLFPFTVGNRGFRYMPVQMHNRVNWRPRTRKAEFVTERETLIADLDAERKKRLTRRSRRKEEKEESLDTIGNVKI